MDSKEIKIDDPVQVNRIGHLLECIAVIREYGVTNETLGFILVHAAGGRDANRQALHMMENYMQVIGHKIDKEALTFIFKQVHENGENMINLLNKKVSEYIEQNPTLISNVMEVKLTAKK
jgi:hypothetical protein